MENKKNWIAFLLVVPLLSIMLFLTVSEDYQWVLTWGKLTILILASFGLGTEGLWLILEIRDRRKLSRQFKPTIKIEGEN